MKSVVSGTREMEITLGNNSGCEVRNGTRLSEQWKDFSHEKVKGHYFAKIWNVVQPLDLPHSGKYFTTFIKAYPNLFNHEILFACSALNICLPVKQILTKGYCL